MMVSTHNLHHLLKIPTLTAECLILNLEDGVSPELKPYALVLCALALASNPVSDKKLVVRVNALDEGGTEEIMYLNAFMPDAIRIPKIRSIENVKRALELIDEGIEVHLSIETKEAWLRLGELAITPRIKAYYLGVLDLFADLGLSQSLLTPDNPTAHYLLSHFLITARACGVKPVSFVYQEHKNSDGLRHWLELEKTIGFDAKGCISPSQVELIDEIFGHSEAEIERMQEIIRLFEEHVYRGITGFVDEQYGFIDEPIYKGALAVINCL
ncbi:MAG: aldolase/citrate lyase family protein [Sulfuricurvum sp.]|nr:aldolase/citrate lyase family protein [Sulfuricurvum sp.]